MNGSWMPLQWDGPTFLLFYIFSFPVLLVLEKFVITVTEVGSDGALDPGRLNPDAYDAAMLLGGPERVIATANRFITRHLAVGLDTMLETEKLPACVTDLYTGLP